MALGMSAADIAVSTRGISELKTNLTKDCTSAKKIASSTGDEFKALEKTIRQYWVGTDCDNFINDLKTAAKTLENNIHNYHSLLDKGLTNYLNGFKSMQKSTYKAGQVKI